MKKVFVYLADGFEETEALVPVDILRRAGADVVLVSITDKLFVTGSHGIKVEAEKMLSDVREEDFDMMLLPGGPGHKCLLECEDLKSIILKANADKKFVAAICAAPMILGTYGCLKGLSATCFPGFEKYLDGATVLSDKPVVVDGTIITGRSAAAALEFALAMVGTLFGSDVVNKVSEQIVVG